MVVNRENKNETEHVKFISYDGRYPNLCSGTLILEVDGEKCYFGWGFHGDEKNYDPFWRSGGCITCDYETESGEWEINYNELPDEFKKYADEIDSLFNENVPYGCCGGCI